MTQTSYSKRTKERESTPLTTIGTLTKGSSDRVLMAGMDLDWNGSLPMSSTGTTLGTAHSTRDSFLDANRN